MSFFTAIFDFLLYPFHASPTGALFFLSILTGIVMVYIFKLTSNQAGIKKTKQRIKGLFLEIRLYQDDLKQSLSSQKNLLRTNLTYMKYSVAPMVIMLVPVLLILIQMHFRFSFEPLKPGDTALVKVFIDPQKASLYDIELQPEEGITLETKALRIPIYGEIDWRIRVDSISESEQSLVLYDGNTSIKTPLATGSELQRIYPELMKKSWLDVLLNPGAPFLDDTDYIQKIEISYPERVMTLFSIPVHWLISFFVLSVIAGFALKKPFGVEI